MRLPMCQPGMKLPSEDFEEGSSQVGNPTRWFHDCIEEIEPGL